MADIQQICSVFSDQKKEFIARSGVENMRRLDLNELMQLPTIYDALASPNHKYVALDIRNIHENIDVFLISAESDSELSPLTHTPEATFSISWAPDSSSLLVSEDRSRNERNVLYQVFVDEPLKMHQITETNPSYFLRGGSFGPNGQFIVYSANFDFEKRKETENISIVLHDLSSNDRIVLTRTQRPSWIEPLVSPNGKFVLYRRNDLHPSGIQYWLVNTDGSDDHEILNFGLTAKINATWTADNRIAFVTDTIGGELQDGGSIGIYDPQTAKVDILKDAREKKIYFERVLAVPKTSFVVFVEIFQTKLIPHIYDLSTGQFVRINVSQGNLLPISPANGDLWYGLYYSSTNPTDLVTFHPGKRVDIDQVTNLTRLLSFTNIKKEDLTPAKEYFWKSVDGLEIHGWLYSPRVQNGKTVVYVHGGPTSHSADKLNPLIQYLCSRGFVVFDPNYRGSTGYGNRFRELIKEEGWGGKEQEDIRAGIESLIAEGIAKRGKIGITGVSYGGYSSWWAITHFPIEIVAAAVPICGMTDLVVDYETTRPDLRVYSEEMLGGTPQERPEKYFERSPINFLEKIKGKLLIVQGLQDPNVTPENLRVVEEKLSSNGIPHEKLEFEDEGHGILKPKNQRVLYRRIADFFEANL